jgi:biopolymer transport protein ExbD
MAGVDIEGGRSGKRAINADINMIPFIDLLMVTVAFLLITAVWVTNSRLNANAIVPGDTTGPVDPQPVEKVLHVHVGAEDVKFSWHHGSTVVSEATVPKPAQADETGSYRALTDRFADEWKQHGGHKDPSDKKLDQVVLHTDNNAPMKEIIGVMDAVYGPKRELTIANGRTAQIPVFNMTFATR